MLPQSAPRASRASSRPCQTTSRVPHSFKQTAAAVAVIAALATIPNAWAVDYTWGGTSNTWTSNSSWTSLTSGPQSSSTGSTDFVIFSNNGTNSFAAPNLTNNRSVTGVQFTSSAFAYTFTGSASRFLDVGSTLGITNNFESLICV